MKKIFVISVILLTLFLNKNSFAFYLCQDFDNPSFPPPGWVLYTTNVYNWDWSIMCSGYGFGNGSMKANFCDANFNSSFDIISPQFASSVSGDSLIFDHAYTTSFAEQNDKLIIWYSSNGGSDWTQLVLLNGGDYGQLTTAPNTGAAFVPTPTQWATKRFALPTGTNKLKFNAISADGNNLYLDNIKIGASYFTDVGASGFKRYIKAISPGSTDTPKVFVKNYGTTSQTFQVTLNISPGNYLQTQTVTSLAPGAIYLLSFPQWTAPSTGNITMKAYTTLNSDQNKSNDTIYNNYIASNNGRNVLVEFSTGIWCSWCPCAEHRVHDLEYYFPNTVTLSYHGGGTSDPWGNFNGNNILTLLDLTAYPLGIVERQIDPWNSGVSDLVERPLMRYLNSPVAPVEIDILTKSYNPGTRQLSVTLNATALTNLTGQYKISYVITEDNLVFAQSGNSWCTGGTDYIHKWVVRTMVNNAAGENLNSGETWSNGQVISKTFTTILGSGWSNINCKLKVFVYKDNTQLNMAEVQQAIQTDILTTGINEPSVNPLKFELSQNYPNPFNPITNIKFCIPKSSYASLKLYNVSGQLIETYYQGDIKAGYYNAEIDGTKLSSGVYFYVLSTNEYSETKKMVLIK